MAVTSSIIGGSPTQSHDPARPKTPEEEIILDIWRQVLDTEVGDIDTDFFALGGDSLDAAQVIARVARVFEVEPGVVSVFEYPTVARLAAALSEKRLQSAPVPAPGSNSSVPDQVPLSFAQERMWFLNRLEPDQPIYHMMAAYRLRGELHVTVLERAFREVIRRHEVLRTTYSEQDGEPRQTVQQPSGVSLPVVQVAGDTEADQLAAALEMAQEERDRPFDLALGSLVRACLLRLGSHDHVLTVTIHHVAFDGWSMDILWRELSSLYALYLGQPAAALAEPPLQYRDFAVWQRDWLQGYELERQVAYWRNKLAGVGMLDTPSDRPRPLEPSYHGATSWFEVPVHLVVELQELSRREGVTLYMTLLAAFQVLLQRLSGQDDIAIGTPIAGRNWLETEQLIGLFVNTLVMRTDLSGDPTFREALARVRRTALEAYRHQDLPFEKLVEELQPARHLNRNPLFDVLFQLVASDTVVPDFPGVAAMALAIPVTAARFDLEVLLRQCGHGLSGRIVYSTDLYDSATIDRLAGSLLGLLADVVASPDRRISRLPLLAEADRRQQLVEWNSTYRPYPAERRVHELIEAQAAVSPDTVAATFENTSLTYGELNARANQLAHYLRRVGVEPDSPVGLYLHRSLDLLIGLLGILKAGGAFMPIDPNFPAQRVVLMVEDASPRVIVSEARLLDALPLDATVAVLMDVDWPKISRGSSENPVTPGTADHLAYLLYTSGSTGRPKGVQITHRSAVNLLTAAVPWLDLAAGDNVLALTTASFDISFMELVLPLTVGARLVMVDRDAAQDGSRLMEVLEKAGITLMQATPSTWRLLLDAGWLGKKDLRALSGGEPLPMPLAMDLIHRTAALWNGYGPTETTVYSTMAPITGETDRITIGRPIANTQAYILDRFMEPVPPGVVGDLYIGGHGISRGYFGRPELTAERFVPNPFSTDDPLASPTIYRTGDRAAYLPNGTINYIGRDDNQVKIRGVRIELGEVENVIASHPDVAESVVVAHAPPGHDTQERQLVAYVVLAPHDQADALEAGRNLRQHLRARLPEVMVPAAFVWLDQLPRLPNGKLDRQGLPEYSGHSQTTHHYVAPRTPEEEAIAAVWATVLGVHTIGVHDDFFELGGHSLLATRVMVRIARVLGIEPRVKSLFENPTVARLAAHLGDTRLTGYHGIAPALIREGDRIPLSFGQERLWFLDQLEPDHSAYHMMSGYRLRGQLDIAALEQALGMIVARHEVLRTVIVVEDGEPRQVVRPPQAIHLDIVEVRERIPEEQQAAVNLIALTERSRRYDLSLDQMIRCQLLRLGSEDHVLLISLHHIASDGWSMRLLWGELAALYQGFLRNERVELPVLAIQYKDYAAWQRRWLQNAEFDRQMAYWQGQLAGVSTLALPTDHPRPAVQSYRGATFRFEVPPELVRELRSLCHTEGITLHMALLAAFQALLHRYTDQLDIAVGTPVAGRIREETEHLIGFFVNTLVMRSDLSGDPTFREFLAQVRRTALDAYSNQDLPFERLVAELRPERQLTTTPLFQVMFDLDERPADGPQLPMVEASPVTMPIDTAKFDLTLMMASTKGKLEAALEYCVDLWDESTIARMAKHYVNLLAAAVDNPEQRIGSLKMIGEAEQLGLIFEFNATTTDFPRDRTLQQLFEAQVLGTPDALAVILPGDLGDRTLSYQELNRQANQLAHWLAAQGVGPDVLVGVYMKRSLELIVAILGIIKAGGAYLPLDIEYPVDRLAFMLQNGCVQVILSQGELAEDLSTLDLMVLCLDTQWSAVESHCDQNPVCQTTPENLAYVMYTSGSTGQPKGTEITHRSVARLLFGVDYVELGADQAILQLAPVAFDASTFEIWGTLLHGGRLVLAPDGVPDLGQLERLIARQGISTLWLTASLFNLIVDHRPGLLSHVRQLLTGGEALSPKHVHTAQRYLAPGALLVNGYGPTETTTFACCHKIPRDLDPASLSVPIGKPIGNTQVYVMDRHGQPVPVGVPGELYIGGDGLARGYHSRPDLTAERFVPLSLSLRDLGISTPSLAPRVFRTGDIVRWLSDGTLEFLGRLDHQVKLRGFRIELGEIETILRQHPDVQSCAVKIVEDPVSGKRLVAYWARVERAGISALDLAEYLRRQLPEYMIPSSFVELDSLPLTAGGKLDRQALRTAGTGLAKTIGVQAKPRTPLEHALATIWAEVLPVAQVGVYDDFFTLGGHSLAAVQVTSRIDQYLGVELPLRTLFENPTVAGLAHQLSLLDATLETRLGEERDEFVF